MVGKVSLSELQAKTEQVRQPWPLKSTSSEGTITKWGTYLVLSVVRDLHSSHCVHLPHETHQFLLVRLNTSNWGIEVMRAEHVLAQIHSQRHVADRVSGPAGSPRYS